MSATGLEVVGDLGFAAWTDLGRRISAISNASAWWLGDWLIYGQRAYGERYKPALEATYLEYQTLRNYAWVARRFRLSRRRDGLSFQHHAVVAARSEPEQELWLTRAERNGWTRNELRRQLGLATRASGGLHDVPSVVVQLQVMADREERWRRAAAVARLPLGDWMAAAADTAAETILTPAAAAQSLTRVRAL
jgi:hypothetical protein